MPTAPTASQSVHSAADALRCFPHSCLRISSHQPYEVSDAPFANWKNPRLRGATWLESGEARLTHGPPQASAPVCLILPEGWSPDEKPFPSADEQVSSLSPQNKSPPLPIKPTPLEAAGMCLQRGEAYLERSGLAPEGSYVPDPKPPLPPRQ